MSIQTALHSAINGRLTNSDGMAVIGDNLDSAANLVQVAIQSLNGRTVRTVTMGKTATGERTMAWEGDAGIDTSLPAGIYSFSVNAVKTDVNSINDVPLIKAAVNGVNKARRK